jgi:hypothetical protein
MCSFLLIIEDLVILPYSLIAFLDLIVFTRFHVQFERYTIVTNREIELANAVIAASSVEVRVCIVLVQRYYLSKVDYRLGILLKPFVAYAPVVKRVDVLFIYFKHGAVIMNCLLIVA